MKFHFWYVNGTVMVIQNDGTNESKVGNIPTNAVVTCNTDNLNEHSLTVMVASLEDKIKPIVKAEQYIGQVHNFSYMGHMTKEDFQGFSPVQNVTPPHSAPVVPDPMGNLSFDDLSKSIKEFQEKLQILQKQSK